MRQQFPPMCSLNMRRDTDGTHCKLSNYTRATQNIDTLKTNTLQTKLHSVGSELVHSLHKPSLTRLGQDFSKIKVLI